MLNETLTYEIWETERSHRIGLSLHEIEQILHALKHDTEYRCVDAIDIKDIDGGYHNIADRLRRLQSRIIVKHELEDLKRLD